MTLFWKIYILVISFGVIAGLLWLIQATRKTPVDAAEGEELHHDFDGIVEYNNPLPKWWLYLFWLTIAFGICYLIYYPTGWKGLGNWSSAGQLQQDIAQHDAKFAELYADFNSTPIEQLAQQPEALEAGKNIYLAFCSVCHGSTAEGAYGFPNLADNDWLYGGDPATIKATINDGRKPQMPAFLANLSEVGVKAVSQYVLSLSGQEHDAAQAVTGQALFASQCSFCHGAEGKGSLLSGLGTVIGAPNLTDTIWLYNNPQLSLQQSVEHTIRNGRAGEMPAWKDILGEEKVHLVSAYVYSLSN